MYLVRIHFCDTSIWSFETISTTVVVNFVSGNSPENSKLQKSLGNSSHISHFAVRHNFRACLEVIIKQCQKSSVNALDFRDTACGLPTAFFIEWNVLIQY